MEIKLYMTKRNTVTNPIKIISKKCPLSRLKLKCLRNVLLYPKKVKNVSAKCRSMISRILIGGFIFTGDLPESLKKITLNNFFVLFLKMKQKNSIRVTKFRKHFFLFLKKNLKTIRSNLKKPLIKKNLKRKKNNNFHVV